MAVGLSSTAVSALSRESLRNQMVTSMFGRRAGMDINGYEVGEQDTRLPIDNIGSTSGTIALSPNGFTVFSASAAATGSTAISGMVIGTILNPTAGIYKTITQISSATGSSVGNQFQVQFGANAQIVTSAGTSFNAVQLAGFGHTVCLACVSSSTSNGPVWIATSPAAAGLAFSTY